MMGYGVLRWKILLFVLFWLFTILLVLVVCVCITIPGKYDKTGRSFLMNYQNLLEGKSCSYSILMG